MTEIAAFTNYFGDILPITVLSYDNNKYAKILKPDGDTDEIKRGYIYADVELTREIPNITWFILGGGLRKNYVARARKTTYSADYVGCNQSFGTKASAVTSALRTARTTGRTITVQIEVRKKTSSGSSFNFGGISILCTPEGLAMQYGTGRRVRSEQGKYLRGYGKVFCKNKTQLKAL